MIRPIVKSHFMLSRPSTEATAADADVAQDLLDTMQAHADECAGMAANMIGQQKRIIAFFDGDTPVVMLNPQVTSHTGQYQAQEGCLSLEGVRTATRWRRITVRYQVLRAGSLAWKTRGYTGWTAQVIQHELDHCNGVLI
ncbi:MAG: peptide deformylase [Atopobiaceae bacterium]